MTDEGGLGIWDFKKLDEAAEIREAIKLWEERPSAWSDWMNEKYIQERSWNEIEPRWQDSTHWKSILAAMAKIRQCASLQQKRNFQWKGQGDAANFKNIFQTVKRRCDKDIYVKGIWAAGYRK